MRGVHPLSMLVLAIVAAGAQSAQAAAALTRYPYVQSLGKDRVTIMWRTATPVIQTVECGLGTAFNHVTSDAVATTAHELTLTGLAPGTYYNYRIREGAEIVLSDVEKYRFKTDAGQDIFSFFFTGDIGAELDDEDQPGKQAITQQMIRNISPRADLGLLCGDIIYPDGESADYDAKLMSLWKDLMCSIPVYPALGNHDWHVDPELNFRKEWALPNNEHWYSFDYGNTHFIALDSADGFLYDEVNQLAWLRQDLAANRGQHTWTVVYYHHPIKTCTYKENIPEMQAQLYPIFDEFRVDLVLNGHAHTYERLYPMRAGNPVDQSMNPNFVDPNGTIYMISGCGGKFKQDEPTTFCGPTAAFKDQAILFTQAFVFDKTMFVLTFNSQSGAIVDVLKVQKTSLTSDVELTPAYRALKQNVPNPFNPTTSIPFELASPARVVLRVYRPDGSHVTDLANRDFMAGHHVVQWDGRDARGMRMPTGVYMCRMDTDNESWSIKMMMLK